MPTSAARGPSPSSPGRWAREPLRLEDWQRDFWWEALEVDPVTGLQVYSEVGLGLPRKNGKSVQASAAGLSFLVADGEAEPEVYVAAAARNQARIVLGHSRSALQGPGRPPRSCRFSDRCSMVCSTSRAVSTARSTSDQVTSAISSIGSCAFAGYLCSRTSSSPICVAITGAVVPRQGRRLHLRVTTRSGRCLECGGGTTTQ